MIITNEILKHFESIFDYDFKDDNTLIISVAHVNVLKNRIGIKIIFKDNSIWEQNKILINENKKSLIELALNQGYIVNTYE